MTARAKPASCAGCPCQPHGTDFSAVEGTGSSGVMLVGEASGEMEARDGLPFRPYAPAGSVLERTIRRMGLDRAQFSITNVLRCRPRNNWLEDAPWEYGATNHCRANLDQAIAERRPRAIVALGGVACRELTGLAGEKRGVTHLAGYVIPSITRPADIQDAIPVVVNFHPAYLRRGKASHQGVFARILQRAVNVARGVDKSWLWNVNPERYFNGPVTYQIHPSIDDALAFEARVRANFGLTLSYDLETVESASLDEDARVGFTDTHIRLIQFSLGAGEGIAFPWEGEYRRIAGRILQLDNVKCGHNVWAFDNKVLRAAAEREGLVLEPRGVVHDTLAMFHHWQPDLPAHLQFAASFVQFPFPWKHLAGNADEFYGCCDADATWRLCDMLVKTMRRDQIWGNSQIGYVGQVYEVRRILERMEERGMPIDDAARVQLGAEFEKAQREMHADILARVPKECGRVHPKDGYKGVPPEVKKVVLADPEAEQIHCMYFREPGDDGEAYHYERRSFLVASINEQGLPVLTPTTRWCRVYDFNPNSSQQLIAYMKVKGHPVPKDKHRENDEGENPDTTAAKELMRLAAKTGDLFYLDVIEYRGMTKLRGTYVDGFVPAADGCVHTTFGFGTGIGQLTSQNPNVQNFPKLKPTPALAKAMRKMVAAKPGRVLTEWDFKSCHVLTLGFLAEDPNWIRLARLDMHSFVAGHLLELWDCSTLIKEPDDVLLKRFKELKSYAPWKKVRDDQAKHGILGIGNGLGAKGLYERYMENFPPRKCPVCYGVGRVNSMRGTRVWPQHRRCHACKGTGMQPGRQVAERVLEIAQQIGPKVFAWQEHVQKQAHEQQLLRTEFGHIRRFYEVFRWDPRRHEMGHGDQAEEAIAFWLANIAFGHIREKLKQLAAAGLDEKYGLFNNVHDSFMFHFDERDLAEHVRDVYPVLVSPSTILRHPTICPGGLVIDVEGAVGKNWAEMSEINTKEIAHAQVVS